jgi:hypothetical protein
MGVFESERNSMNMRLRLRLATLALAIALLTACIPVFVGDAFQTLKLVFKLNDKVSVGEDRIVQVVVFPESVKVKKNFVQVSGKLDAPASGQLPAEIEVEAVIRDADTDAVKQKVALTLEIDAGGRFNGNKKIKKNIGADQKMIVTLSPTGSDLLDGTEITLCVDLVKPKSKLEALPACVEDDSGSDPGGDPQETLMALQNDFFTPTCALAGCHSVGSAQAGLVLASGQSFGNLVNTPSTQQPNLRRVLPFDPESSYLIRKLRGDAGISGDRMPRTGNFLSDAEIARFVTWINEGAPNN